MKTTIPFSGFYESNHSHLLNDALESVARSGDGEVNYPLLDRLFSEINWGLAHEKYARIYCDTWCEKHGVKAKFEDLVSPREYNFQTDRIFATISKSEVRRIWKCIDKERFTQKAKSRFTSCSGFISHYSTKWESWGPIENWDHNQVGTLLETLTEPYEELWVLDDLYEAASRAVETSIGKRGWRLINYLYEREQRSCKTA